MTLQRFFLVTTLLGSSLALRAEITPKFSGQIWLDAHYLDRFEAQEFAFEVSRALLDIRADLAPQWSADFSFRAATGASATLYQGYIQYLSTEGTRVQLGRVQLPYYEYTEQSFSQKWAFLESQAEYANFVDYRDEGVRFDFAANPNLRLALMIRNGADGVDADLGWNATFAWKASEQTRLQLMIDQQTQSKPLNTPALTTVLGSIGIKNSSYAGLLELNYQNVDPGGAAPTSDRVGFGLSGQYSLNSAIDADTDRGVLASVFTGSKNYKVAQKYDLRFSFGGYRNISKNLRTSLQGVVFTGNDATANSSGIGLYWNWEAKF
ncbi:MAG: hypothetical protein ABIR96_05970 [Bdellovibrionota bacterium]